MAQTADRTSTRSAPAGMRWATGGGSPIGDCNGYHLARGPVHGTLCGRYGPSTPPDPPLDQAICGSCARIANVARQSSERRANTPASTALSKEENRT